MVVDVRGAHDVPIVGEWPTPFGSFLEAFQGIGDRPANATRLAFLVARGWQIDADVHGGRQGDRIGSEDVGTLVGADIHAFKPEAVIRGGSGRCRSVGLWLRDRRLTSHQEDRGTGCCREYYQLGRVSGHRAEEGFTQSGGHGLSLVVDLDLQVETCAEFEAMAQYGRAGGCRYRRCRDLGLVFQLRFGRPEESVS